MPERREPLVLTIVKDTAVDVRAPIVPLETNVGLEQVVLDDDASSAHISVRSEIVKSIDRMRYVQGIPRKVGHISLESVLLNVDVRL